MIDARFVKPLDAELLEAVARRTRRVITIEDHARAGGFGSAVLECLSDRGVPATVERLGLPDRFIDHGGVEDQWREAGIDVAALVERALARCGEGEAHK